MGFGGKCKVEMIYFSLEFFMPGKILPISRHFKKCHLLVVTVIFLLNLLKAPPPPQLLIKVRKICFSVNSALILEAG